MSLLLLVLACGMGLLRQKRRFAAGLVFSLLSIKFHLVLLLPVMLLVKKQMDLLRGMTAGGLFLLLLNFVWAGWRWPVEQWHAMTNPIASPGPYMMPNLYGLAWHLGNTRILEPPLIAVVLIITLRVLVVAEFEIALAAAMFGSLLISHHSYAQDAAVSIPALLTTWRQGSTFASACAFVLLTPLPYFLQFNPPLGFVTPALFCAVLAGLLFGKPSPAERIA